MYQSLIVGCFILICLSCKPKEKQIEVNQFYQTMCAPQTSDQDWYLSDTPAPLFEGLNVLNFPITTQSNLAQQYFNQGLILSFGFNHAEAARSFYYATKLDTSCAMAYWGYAMVLGPNYNAGMDPGNYDRAFEAIQKAVDLKPTNKKEYALIQALSKRYVQEPVEDRTDLDIAYANAMKGVFNLYPRDAHIGALTAEALMDLHPWDLWEKNSAPKMWTQEILSTLEAVFDIDARHPGGHHLYIHAVEASPSPEDGLKSAQLFDEGLVPGAGHLLHMPSHIYIRTGDYHKGTLANIRAVNVDSTYVTACHAQGAYPIAYYPHNYHFLSATATLAGDSKWAIRSADKIRKQANHGLLNEPGWGTIQHYYSIPYYVLVKLGHWQQILELPEEKEGLTYPRAMRHYARGMAYLGSDNLESAQEELLQLNKLSLDPQLKEITIWEINSVHTLVELAKKVLKGELLASQRKYEEAIDVLIEAVAIEDELNYNEPPDWFFSIRHHLGAVQLEAGKYQDAEYTFIDDLKIYPKNGWALHGQRKAYKLMGAHDKAKEIDNLINEVWNNADIQIETSRIK